MQIAVLEHDEQLVVFLRQVIRAAPLAAHRHREPRPERLLILGEVRDRDLDPIAGVIRRRVLVLHDGAEPYPAVLRGPRGLLHRTVDWEKAHAILIVGASKLDGEPDVSFACELPLSSMVWPAFTSIVVFALILIVPCLASIESLPSLHVISSVPSIDEIETPVSPDIGGL